MKLNRQRSPRVADNQLKKSITVINIFCLGMIGFLTLASHQFSNHGPAWLWNSAITVAVMAVMMFAYGLWLRTNYSSRYQLGIFAGVFILFTSIQLLIISNIQFAADQYLGKIVEEVDFLKISATSYLAGVLGTSLGIFLLSSPRLLFRRIKSVKGYIVSTLLGVIIVLAIIIAMLSIQRQIFVQPQMVKQSYDFLIGSVLFGYSAISLMIVMYRAEVKGVN